MLINVAVYVYEAVGSFEIQQTDNELNHKAKTGGRGQRQDHPAGLSASRYWWFFCGPQLTEEETFAAKRRTESESSCSQMEVELEVDPYTKPNPELLCLLLVPLGDKCLK